ncbi:zinc finger BED domain-containing protein RICESLEEPER 2-like protein [Tanacetum coccineum]
MVVRLWCCGGGVMVCGVGELVWQRVWRSGVDGDDDDIDGGGFWKAKESIFLVLSRMAIDIISVQAALVVSGRVLSIRRTRLTLASLEMHFEEEILDAEVQQNKAIPLSEEEIALDVASSEGTMSGSGSGSGGEEVDYDMMNYGDDY